MKILKIVLMIFLLNSLIAIRMKYSRLDMVDKELKSAWNDQNNYFEFRKKVPKAKIQQTIDNLSKAHRFVEKNNEGINLDNSISNESLLQSGSGLSASMGSSSSSMSSSSMSSSSMSSSSMSSSSYSMSGSASMNSMNSSGSSEVDINNGFTLQSQSGNQGQSVVGSTMSVGNTNSNEKTSTCAGGKNKNGNTSTNLSDSVMEGSATFGKYSSGSSMQGGSYSSSGYSTSMQGGSSSSSFSGMQSSGSFQGGMSASGGYSGSSSSSGGSMSGGFSGSSSSGSQGGLSSSYYQSSQNEEKQKNQMNQITDQYGKSTINEGAAFNSFSDSQHNAEMVKQNYMAQMDTMSSSLVNKSSSSSYQQLSKSSSSGKDEFHMFTCSKEQIQNGIDSRYQVVDLVCPYVSAENSIRFYAKDSIEAKTIIIKLYMKGKPEECKFYDHTEDSYFHAAKEDCMDLNSITNRFYNAPQGISWFEYKKKLLNEGKINQLQPVFQDMDFAKCSSDLSQAIDTKMYFFNIYEISKGENLKGKCYKKPDQMSSNNSCIGIVKQVAVGTIHFIQLMNMGTSFYSHGNIKAKNMYIEQSESTSKVMIDNKLYDHVKFDNPTQKPFAKDFRMLGKVLVSILLGSNYDSVGFQEPFKSTFDLFAQISMYIKSKKINIELFTSTLDMSNFMYQSGLKSITTSEFEFKLQKTVFNLMYRLLQSESNSPFQFNSPAQALEHDSIRDMAKKGINPKAMNNPFNRQNPHEKPEPNAKPSADTMRGDKSIRAADY